ncbi:lamin tail domain-containing protein [bacterium]|nr:lamin tail domain-containing protein [bacterium]
MRKFTIWFVMAVALVFSSFVTAQDHLLLTEIVVNPTDAEFVEIYNPTDATIDLSNYYLTDATYEYGSSYYYNIAAGTDYGGGAYGDFHARFPDGAMIEAGEYQTVAMNGDSAFMAIYGVLPTYEIGEDSTGGDDVPDMREAVEGSVSGIQGGLTNGDEVLILYYWDGMTDLVQDIDYLLWDNGAEVPNESVDKTGVTIDGPDADTDSSTYLNDTPTASQAFAASPAMGMSIQRIDMTEGTELKTGGNGMTGNDETSENLNETWAEADPTPNAAAVSAEAPTVTFQCDMSIQIAANNFDPAGDKLLVRGTINGWAGTDDELTDPDADQIYTLTKEFTAADIGTAQEYKHVLVPAAGGDIWENVDNRKFTIAGGAQVLDVVFYDNVSVLLETALVTFQGDMSDLLDNGWFDPATDSVRVVGGMNGWANNESAEPDPFDPSLYIYEMDVTAAPASEITWKFRAYPNDSFLDGGWEGGDGHTFEFLGAGQDLVLDPVKPNLLPAGKELAQAVTVRFSVDVNGSVDYYNEEPFENIEKVFVTGDWNNWGGAWSVADTTVLINMYDDGTKGDAVAGDGIWTTEVLFEAGVSNTRLYKYSIYAAGVDTLNGGTESMDNEAGTGMNHVVIIEDTNPTFVVPQDYFGSQWREVAVERLPVSILPTEFSLKQNYPNPFNPATTINYDLPNASVVKLSVFNSIGQRIASLVNEEQVAGSYQVVWNARDDMGNAVSTGVYFYYIQADNFARTMKMLYIK